MTKLPKPAPAEAPSAVKSAELVVREREDALAAIETELAVAFIEGETRRLSKATTMTARSRVLRWLLNA